MGVVAAHTLSYPPDLPSQLYDMFRWYKISPCSEPMLQSLSSDLTKYLTNKRFNDLLEYWGKDQTNIRALADFQPMELAQVAQGVLLMVHILLYEASNNHHRLEPSDAVFVLRENFPSAFSDICGLSTSSSQILSKEFLGAAVASGDIEWTKSLLKQGVRPYSNVYLLDIALSSKDAPIIDLLWQSGFAGHITFLDLWNLDTDVRLIALSNMLRSKLTQIGMGERKCFYLAEDHCGTLLVEAASKGRTIEVTALMDLHESAIGARWLHPSWLGLALRAAVRFRHFQTAERLINSGAHIHSSGTNGAPGSHWEKMAPIQIAAEENSIDLVKLLLHHGAKTNLFRTGASGGLVDLTPLQYAARNCNFDMVRILLDAGSHPDLDVDGIQGDTPLQISIRRDNERIYGLLLSSGASVNSRPAIINGRTAIQAAAGTGNIRVAQMLLQKGTFLNAAPGEDRGMTALQAAALGGHSAMIEMLVAKGADVNARPAPLGGMTALQAAAAGGNHKVVKSLIRLGADVKAPTARRGGKTPLEAAVPHRDLDMLETLITHGAEVNTVDHFARATALEIASQIGWLGGAKYLLHRGAKANVNITGDDGCHRVTALEWAIKNSDYQMLQLLLENGAAVNITSTDPPFSRCVLRSLSEATDATIVSVLLQHDANPEKTFGNGRLIKFALQMAYPCLEVYKLLLERMTVLPKPIWIWEIQKVWQYLSADRFLRETDPDLHRSIADLLLDAGANIDGRSETIGTCLQVILGHGDEELADYLLFRGANSDAPATQNFGTPLQEAVANGCYNIIPKLLQGGADVNAAPCLDKERSITALQGAADKGLMNLTRILLEAGADVTAGHNGGTAIDISAYKGRIDMVALLLKWLPIEANLLATCETAASVAEWKNYVELAEWLREYPASRGRGTIKL